MKKLSDWPNDEIGNAELRGEDNAFEKCVQELEAVLAAREEQP